MHMTSSAAALASHELGAKQNSTPPKERVKVVSSSWGDIVLLVSIALARFDESHQK